MRVQLALSSNGNQLSVYKDISGHGSLDNSYNCTQKLQNKLRMVLLHCFKLGIGLTHAHTQRTNRSANRKHGSAEYPG
jgi:hypothetical protein